MSGVELADAVVDPNLNKRCEILLTVGRHGSGIYAVVIMFSYTVLA